MKAIVLVLIGIVLGGLVMADNQTVTPSKTGDILGHRIGPGNQEMLVTK